MRWPSRRQDVDVQTTRTIGIARRFGCYGRQITDVPLSLPPPPLPLAPVPTPPPVRSALITYARFVRRLTFARSSRSSGPAVILLSGRCGSYRPLAVAAAATAAAATTRYNATVSSRASPTTSSLRSSSSSLLLGRHRAPSPELWRPMVITKRRWLSLHGGCC